MAAQIAEAGTWGLGEVKAEKALNAFKAMRAARQARVEPIRFSPAQIKHLKAYKDALDKRFRQFEREREKQIRQEEQERAEFKINLTLGQEANRLASPILKEHAERKGATFTVAEYKLLQLGLQSNPTEETRHKVGQLLNERALLATGGPWGKGKL
jgi:hypothetical protein